MWRLYCSPLRCSSITIWIVLFGQTFSHCRHQIQRSWLHLWTPRKRGLTSGATSGYSTVNVSPSRACFIVVAMDFMMPIIVEHLQRSRRQQRSSGDHPDDGRSQQEIRKREHEHPLPADLDELVDTDARNRRARPLGEQEDAPYL